MTPFLYLMLALILLAALCVLIAGLMPQKDVPVQIIDGRSVCSVDDGISVSPHCRSHSPEAQPNDMNADHGHEVARQSAGPNEQSKLSDYQLIEPGDLMDEESLPLKPWISPSQKSEAINAEGNGGSVVAPAIFPKESHER